MMDPVCIVKFDYMNQPYSLNTKEAAKKCINGLILNEGFNINLDNGQEIFVPTLDKVSKIFFNIVVSRTLLQTINKGNSTQIYVNLNQDHFTNFSIEQIIELLTLVWEPISDKAYNMSINKFNPITTLAII